MNLVSATTLKNTQDLRVEFRIDSNVTMPQFSVELAERRFSCGRDFSYRPSLKVACDSGPPSRLHARPTSRHPHQAEGAQKTRLIAYILPTPNPLFLSKFWTPVEFVLPLWTLDGLALLPTHSQGTVHVEQTFN